MVVLLVHDFIVKSSIHDYKVCFINKTRESIKSEVETGDVFIIDKKIEKLYPELIDLIGRNNSIIKIRAHEKTISYEGLKNIIAELIQLQFKKNNRLVCIGGGITQDVTSFISSIMYRGVKWIYFPTTLLAQGDSCIGSKTSINFEGIKNQLGGFYPPNKIFININFLKTLSKADIQSGLGEMCHYFVIAGKNDFIKYKEGYKNSLLLKKELQNIIVRSLSIKKEYIEIDEFDKDKRQIFNYGHSFGHAIETLTNFSVPHGIAVSFGMDIANYISVKLGLLNSSIRHEIRDQLKEIWQGYDISGLNIEDFSAALGQDKKNIGDELGLILCKGYGKVFKTFVNNNNQLKLWLDEYLTN